MSRMQPIGAEGAAPHSAPGPGRVVLVGSGPGDPDLLTVKALKLLQTADVVLYDMLVAKPILDLINPAAVRIFVGKKGYGDTRPQDGINAQLIAQARLGRLTVRLKSGDPLIFGRAGEEIEACRAAGVPVEVVPGITSAQGAAARLTASLTHRMEARRLQYITGHDATGGLPESLDWRAIADPQATTVVYMPRRTIGELVRRALGAGLAAATPAIVAINATRPDERFAVSTLGDLARAVAATETPDPTLVLIGQALAHARLPEPVA
jgi:uroporphyrin-III C-methyltransferase/precorrin-2 dehydrogenase/sirohydrochlorin ferrochelatase